ncbi:pseudouridine synthase-like protein [Polyplosphaeria fusca]|uniref:tRNA pseudouridine(55) synthase n=1 Tax=Polyplosphaeria fusca TaxID=682080 RepID=A0A9P4UZR0_9PLEO|nr:pseudouridine synthase-like protein [Polyplosphaeria fusca]
MASPERHTVRKVLEGIFAVNKPQWQSSAGVLRDLNTHLDSSDLFRPWLDFTRRQLILANAKKRNIQNLKVKLGHGGTLDPLATGVLIVGVGKGTKCLQRFLECTKTYECVVLFGAATDSYDVTGKVVNRAPYEHVTKEIVEKALEQFRGNIMQKPSVFSALKVDGKKMYEYARAGGDIPEVKARPVEVQELELVEWLEPGTHKYKWPEEEAGGAEKAAAQKLMGVKGKDAGIENEDETRGTKRARSDQDDLDDLVTPSEAHSKKPRTDDEPSMSGALPSADDQPTTEPTQDESTQTKEPPAQPDAPPAEPPLPAPLPPAARLRMTVSSGFYVRSLCHDLGVAVQSHGLMSSLIRSRQGAYTLGANVLEYADFEAGPDVWQPKLQAELEKFMADEGWEAQEVDENDETWREGLGERREERREADRERSFRGGRRDGGRGRRDGGKRNYYSKDMRGGADRGARRE